jgi:hypothetical protein
MKSFKFLLIILFSLSLFSCSLKTNNGDETYIINFATVSNPNAITLQYYLNLDNGTRLFTSQIGEAQSSSVPTDGLRVLANYSLINKAPANSGYDYNIQINSVNPVPILKLTNLTKANKDTIIGNNPFTISLINAGDNYLNVLFNYGLSSTSYTHTITLVKNTLKTYLNDGKVHLDLFYNNGGDIGTTVTQSGACFDLTSLKGTATDSINLVINTYNNNDSISYPVTYKWK